MNEVICEFVDASILACLGCKGRYTYRLNTHQMVVQGYFTTGELPKKMDGLQEGLEMG